MKGGKVIVSLVSLILVVGVVIGVVAVANRNGNSSKVENVPATSANIKAVASICAVTDYKDTCMNSLSSVAKNESAAPKDYIMAVIEATLEEIKKSRQVAQSVKVDAGKDNTQHMAVEDCKELLQYAAEDLQESLSRVGDSVDVQDIRESSFEILNWFTAVLSHQTLCLEQLNKPEYKTPIENGLLNATQLTSNAIDIVARFSEILGALNIPVDDINPNTTSNSRRLLQLQVNEIGQDGFPSWFSAADRKLMAMRNHRKRGVGARKKIRPNAVVAKDGSGNYKTIQEAVNAIKLPKERPGGRGRWIIYVKAGLYNENVVIPRFKDDVFMYGDGPDKTIVTGSRSVRGGSGMKESATFGIDAHGFIAERMGFRNTAGPDGEQALALRSNSDRSAFFQCNFEAYQDTLYYQAYRQFYRDCVISGTVDFIYGGGTALIQNSRIIARATVSGKQNMVTADGNDHQNAIGGVVLQNCNIVAEPRLLPTTKTYLGRPWKKFAVTAVIECELGAFIQEAGWMEWQGTPNHKTATIVEYGNRGPRSDTRNRAKWPKFRAIVNPIEIRKYTSPDFLEGPFSSKLKQESKVKLWLRGIGFPITHGLTYRK